MSLSYIKLVDVELPMEGMLAFLTQGVYGGSAPHIKLGFKGSVASAPHIKLGIL